MRAGLPRAAAADTRPEFISAPSSPSPATPSARRFVCSPLPATISNLLAGGTGPCVQLFAMAAFIVVVAALQRHMGIHCAPVKPNRRGYHDHSRSPAFMIHGRCSVRRDGSSSARRSKPIAAARRVGFSFRLAASAGTGSVVEALEEQGVHKLLRILQPLTGGNHETGSTRDLSYRACTWRLPPGIAGISADEARIDSSAFCSAIMSLS